MAKSKKGKSPESKKQFHPEENKKLGIDWQSEFDSDERDLIEEDIHEHVADMVEKDFHSGNLTGEEPSYSGWWTVTIEEDENDSDIRNEEVARLIREGNTSGYSPQFTFQANVWKDDGEKMAKGGEIKTIRDLAKEHPKMYDYHYKWRNTENPELEKDINEVLMDYGYKITEEDEEYAGEYNDLKGYLNVDIEPIMAEGGAVKGGSFASHYGDHGSLFGGSYFSSNKMECGGKMAEGGEIINGVKGIMVKGDAIDYHKLEKIESGSPLGGEYFIKGEYGYAQSGYGWFKFKIKDLKGGKKASGGDVEERGEFGKDTDKWWDGLAELSSDMKDDEDTKKLLAITKKSATKENLEEFKSIVKSCECPKPELKKAVLEQIENIIDGKYKKEFRFTYGGKAGDISKVSATSDFFDQFRQAATYNH